MEVRPWKPSPDGRGKRILAAQILRELQEFGYSDVKAVFTRDFNIEDPEIDFYIVGPRNEADFLGCSFDRNRSPYCQWHLYGQAPTQALKRRVMAMPYRLSPPPVGPASIPAAKRREDARP
jgi:hypothetical protein